jgi:hypothetical protein
MSRYHQDIYKVQNRKKYLGDGDPVYKSSLEQRAFYYFDHNINILRWGYEMVKVPYFFQYDQKFHHYITDAYAEVRNSSGEMKNYLVEIKPESQSMMDANGKLVLPKPPKRKTPKSWQSYQNRLIEAHRNVAKWDAAKAFCAERGWEFKIVTDKHLGIY